MRSLRAAARRVLRPGRQVRPPSDRPSGGPANERLLSEYVGFTVRPIEYATVRDFSDSLQRLNQLATAQGDLKDVQRPWMVKALASLLSKGGRIVEVGGGQPYVADALAHFGFDVTIVDPYDGSANGPRDYETYREAYPNVSFLRAAFDADITHRLPAGSYDAVFSISVLEHLGPKAIESVIAGTRSVLREHGWSVHSVDHVMHGRDEAQSLERLGVLARLHGIATGDLRRALDEAQADPETYFLSAESHERWRSYLGHTYEQYPMQRVVSVSVAARREQITVGPQDGAASASSGARAASSRRT